MSRPRLRWRAIAAAGFAGLGALALSACDLQSNADLDRGRTLFQTKCGTCHKLAEAGTATEIGPDLDASFADARSKGMDDDTIEGIVQGQIENPREITLDPNDPDYGRTYMPANIVEDQDAEDVAAYVASVAGVPGIGPPKLPTPELFAESCGSCHALKAAGTSGPTGPDLDEVLPGQSEKQVEQSIVDPEAKISPGYDAGIMPATFRDSLTIQQISALVSYLLENAGK